MDEVAASKTLVSGSRATRVVAAVIFLLAAAAVLVGIPVIVTMLVGTQSIFGSMVLFLLGIVLGLIVMSSAVFVAQGIGVNVDRRRAMLRENLGALLDVEHAVRNVPNRGELN